MDLRGATQSSSSLEDIALRDADPDVVDATDPFVAQPFSADVRIISPPQRVPYTTLARV
jgi:hypothetical protein